MAAIHYIGDTSHTHLYVCEEFSDFQKWFRSCKIIAHDVETNVVDSIIDRELRVIQYSDVEGIDNWVIQWSFLRDYEKEWIVQEMQNSWHLFLIFASTFEGTIWQNYGAQLQRVFDCYVVEQILNTGYTQELGMFSLAGTLKRRFEIDISKAEQLEFGDNILTDAKIQYAATDTLKLGALYDIQKRELKQVDAKHNQPGNKGLRKTAWWDNEFILVAADMEYTGVTLDQNKWLENYNVALPQVEQSKSDLNKLLRSDFYDEAVKAGFLYTEDTFHDTIWSSAKKKLGLLQLEFPNLEATSKLELKKYLQENDPEFPLDLKLSGKAWLTSDYPVSFNDKFASIKALILLNKENGSELIPGLNQSFFETYRDYMVENELVILKDSLVLNWASPAQKLIVFKWMNPEIVSTNAQTVTDNLLTHPLFRKYAEYQEMSMLITKFGLGYLRHVTRDGKIRTRFNTVLSTGRLSAREPNIMQLPHRQEYRDCFIADEGTKIVGADYSGQELVIIATLSQDPVWLDALSTGKDLHSINAHLIYEKEWEDAAESDCAYFKWLPNGENAKQKCKCPGHKKLRDTAKTIGFGLSYGLSPYGAAARLQITVKEAEELIKKFFTTFPRIQKALLKWGTFGVQNLFITESVMGRVRFFNKSIRFVEGGEEGAARQAMNFPVQSSAAATLKISGVLLRRWINQSGYKDKIKLLIPAHDEWVLRADDDIADLAAEKLTHYMELAGKLALGNDLLKADSYVADNWIKD